MKLIIRSLFVVTLVMVFFFTPFTSYAVKGKTAGLGLTNSHQAKKSMITPDNIHKMQHLWSYETTDPDEFNEFAGVEVMPLKKAGVLYFPSTNGFLHAVDAKSGARIWRKSFRFDYSNENAGRIFELSRNTPVIKGGVLYIATTASIDVAVPIPFLDLVICETSNNAPNCRLAQTGTWLLAINPLNGELIHATQLDDNIFSQATASPVVHKGKIVVTLSSLEELTSSAFDPEFGNEPENSYYRCCRFRGKTVAVNLDGTIAWEFWHVPTFNEKDDNSNLKNNNTTAAFEQDLQAFNDAMKVYLDALGPGHPRYVPLGDDLPRHEGFFGAASWGKGNPAVDKKRGLVLVAPGSNYTVPDLVRQCQRKREDNSVTPDPDNFLPAGFTCDSINDKLDNYLNSVVALDINTGQVVWVMQDDQYDAWNSVCHSHDAGWKFFFSNVIGPLLGTDIGGRFAQENECDPLVKANDFGFPQLPMILRDVYVNGPYSYPMDIVVIGQKDGTLYRFDIETGGTLFFDRQRYGDGGIYGGFHMGHATDGKRIYMTFGNAQASLRDVREPYISARDDDGQDRGDGLIYNIRKGDPRLPARTSGPRDIRPLVNPPADTFVDADVRIRFDRSCSFYDPGSESFIQCLSFSNLLGDNPYKRTVTIVGDRDWRDKQPGESIGGVITPNTIPNPVPNNVEGVPGNKIMTVRDLEDCSGSQPDTCKIKTAAGFWLAIDARTGDELWSRPHPGGGVIHGAMTLSGKILYSGALGSEEIYADPAFFPLAQPPFSEVPKGGGLRYALHKNTGEILLRFHTILEQEGIEVDEYPLANPLVLKKKVIWGSGWGNYNNVDTTNSGNKLHAFKLVLANDSDDDDGDNDDSDGEDVDVDN